MITTFVKTPDGKGPWPAVFKTGYGITSGGSDTFMFDGGSVGGNVDGGFGPGDVLDYSGTTTAVTATLIAGSSSEAGSATSIDGSFTGIESFVGSSASGVKMKAVRSRISPGDRRSEKAGIWVAARPSEMTASAPFFLRR